MEIKTNRDGIIQIILKDNEFLMITNKSHSHFKKILCCADGTLDEVGEVIL